MKYFTNCNTLEDLKKEYRNLAMKNHPDRGGNLETMQTINANYDTAFKRLKNKHVNCKGESYEKDTTETCDWYKDIIDQLIRMEGLEIEVIGSFIWVTGNTKAHKDALKNLKFKWHSKKLCWYLPPVDYIKRSKNNLHLMKLETCSR